MTRRLIVILTAVIAAFAFIAAVFLYQRHSAQEAQTRAASQADALVRLHSPVLGPAAAPVTIVEFFDPSCEACRAFYPYVKQILAAYPKDVRLVVRYAPFHQGSDEAVAILELARAQGKFGQVLEALLAHQSQWAAHGAPDLRLAWSVAASAGLMVDRDQVQAIQSKVAAILKQDMDDVKALAVEKTPTFFVNGKPLTTVGPQQLFELVKDEVVRSRAAS